MRVCRRISEWIGLFRFRAALPVRLRHKKTGIMLAEGLTLASPCQGQSGLAAHERAMAMEARETSRGLPNGIELLAAAGPALLLFKELFRVGRCMSHRSNAGKHG